MTDPGGVNYLLRRKISIPRKLEKCQISQDILWLTMCLERRCTLCTASERHAVWRKRDKKDGASEVTEEVYYLFFLFLAPAGLEVLFAAAAFTGAAASGAGSSAGIPDARNL